MSPLDVKSFCRWDAKHTVGGMVNSQQTARHFVSEVVSKLYTTVHFVVGMSSKQQTASIADNEGRWLTETKAGFSEQNMMLDKTTVLLK